MCLFDVPLLDPRLTTYNSNICVQSIAMFDLSTSTFMSTSHIKLHGHDHYIPRSSIGWKGWDRPSSLHTRRWRPKGPKEIITYEKSTWIPTIKLQQTFHVMPEFASSPPPRGKLDSNPNKPCELKSRYILWRRVKGPHNFMVITLGSCVTWPLGPILTSQKNKVHQGVFLDPKFHEMRPLVVNPPLVVGARN